MGDIDMKPFADHMRKQIERLRIFETLRASGTNPRRSEAMSELQINDFLFAIEQASERLNEERTLGNVEPVRREINIKPEQEFMVQVEIPQKKKRQIFKLQEEK
jgi:hypothetical protein